LDFPTELGLETCRNEGESLDIEIAVHGTTTKKQQQ
jgi:hypothetical protein